MGRWINKDPYKEKGGLNLYGFAQNNSLNYWDFLGLTDYSDEVVHYNNECKRNAKTCAENIEVLLKNVASAHQRFLYYTPQLYQKALRREVMPPGEQYNNVKRYDDAWNGHRSPLKTRLKRVAKCIKVIKNQYDDGECNCCDDFFKKLPLIQYEYDKMWDNFPPVIPAPVPEHPIMETAEKVAIGVVITGYAIQVVTFFITFGTYCPGS